MKSPAALDPPIVLYWCAQYVQHNHLHLTCHVIFLVSRTMKQPEAFNSSPHYYDQESRIDSYDCIYFCLCAISLIQ